MSAKSVINLQDGFLNQIRKDNILTTVYLVNGLQLKGLVKGFDNFTVLLDVDGKQMLIYKARNFNNQSYQTGQPVRSAGERI